MIGVVCVYLWRNVKTKTCASNSLTRSQTNHSYRGCGRCAYSNLIRKIKSSLPVSDNILIICTYFAVDFLVPSNCHFTFLCYFGACMSIAIRRQLISSKTYCEYWSVKNRYFHMSTQNFSSYANNKFSFIRTHWQILHVRSNAISVVPLRFMLW